MGRRVQYARNYLELFDLFERNGIDVWMTTSEIVDQTDEAGIEWATQGDFSGGILRWKLIEALRNADMSGQDRAAAVRELERERCEESGETMLDSLATSPFLAPEHLASGN